MKTIIFDDQSVCWVNDVEANRAYLIHQTFYINEIFRMRGYIYLNQIYEKLGIFWNPNLVNLCYRIESGPIHFEFEPTEDGAILVKFG